MTSTPTSTSGNLTPVDAAAVVTIFTKLTNAKASPITVPAAVRAVLTEPVIADVIVAVPIKAATWAGVPDPIKSLVFDMEKSFKKGAEAPDYYAVTLMMSDDDCNSIAAAPTVTATPTTPPSILVAASSATPPVAVVLSNA